MNSIDKDIRLVECQISDLDLQIQLSSPSYEEAYALFSAHRSLSSKYFALLRQSNLRWAQRSQLMWVLNGDVNSSFFNASAHLNKHKNSIFQVIDQQGSV